jgi:chromosome partitioning protein
MPTIAIIGQKGGSGKSTLTVGLAVTAAHVGHNVVVIDTDPQTSVADWADRRTGENPTVVSVHVNRLGQTVEAAQMNESDFILIDTAGKNESAAIQAARLSDIVLIPSRPQIFDMNTLPTARDLVRAAGDPPAFVVYNFVHPQGHQLVEKLKALTKEHCGIEPCPVHITQRAIHAEAQAQGKGPSEVDPTNAAVSELERLYLFVKNTVSSSTSGISYNPTVPRKRKGV